MPRFVRGTALSAQFYRHAIRPIVDARLRPFWQLLYRSLERS
jgi:hypothetical protein